MKSFLIVTVLLLTIGFLKTNNLPPPKNFNGIWKGEMIVGKDGTYHKSKAYLSILGDFLIWNSEFNQFIGLMNIVKKEGQTYFAEFQGKSKEKHMQYDQQTQKTYWKYSFVDVFQRELIEVKEYPDHKVMNLWFNSTNNAKGWPAKENASGNITLFQYNNTGHADLKGLFLMEDKIVKPGARVDVDDGLMLIYQKYFTFLALNRTTKDFTIFSCEFVVDDTKTPHRLTGKEPIVNLEAQKEDQYMIYSYNKTQNNIFLNIGVKIQQNATQYPTDFNDAELFMKYRKSLDIKHIENVEWYGLMKDPNSGEEKQTKIKFHNGVVENRQKNFVFTGAYNVDNTKNPKHLTVFGVSANRIDEKGRWNHFGFHLTKLIYQSENNNKILKVGQIMKKGGDRPKSFDEPNIEILTLSNNKTKGETKPLIISDIHPRSGTPGSTVFIYVRKVSEFKRSLLHKFRGTYGPCPAGFVIKIGGKPFPSYQCDVENYKIKAVVPNYNFTGPVKLSYISDGFEFSSEVLFTIVKENVQYPRISKIVPDKGSSNGNTMVTIPIFDTPIDGKTVKVDIGYESCQNVQQIGSGIPVVHCKTPSGSGRQLVKVSVDGIFAKNPLYFTYTSMNSIQIGKVVPEFGTVDGGKKINIIIFVPNGDGTVPKDLSASVTIGNEHCTELVGPTPTAHKTLYLVSCKTPKSGSTGKKTLLFYARTEGSTFIGASQFRYIKPGAKKNVIIKKIHPKFGPQAGGNEITIEAFVPTGYNNGDEELKATIGSSDCKITSSKLDGNKGTVKCTAPSLKSGSYPVILIYPGGVSISKTLYTYKDANSPSISSILPKQIQSDKPNNFTISGKFIPSSKRSSDSNTLTINCADVSVNLNDNPCENVECKSDTEISATCPPSSSSGEALVVVSYQGSQTPSDTEIDGAAVLESTSTTSPTFTSISPISGTENGGTEVTITGTNFGSTASDLQVTFNGSPCEDIVIVNSGTTLKCTTPAGSGNSSIVISKTGESTIPMKRYQYNTEVTPTPSPVKPVSPGNRLMVSVGLIILSILSICL